MKILYICNEYPPYKHGGIGSFTRDIAEGLASNGQQVVVWGMYNTVTTIVNENINGVAVVRLPFKAKKSRFKQLHFIYFLNRQLKLFLKDNNFDIVECQEWQGLLPFGLQHPGYITRLHGAAIFFDTLLKRPGNRMMHWLEKLTIKKAKHIIAVSDYCGQVTLQMMSLKKSYHVIYNAVNTSRLSNFAQNNYTAYSIVFANSVLPKKGIFQLVEAFNIVQQKFPDATLTIIGKVGYHENGVSVKELITRKLNTQSIEKVNITGWLPNADDVYHHLASAHVCCYPSHMEGFGIAPVEAMALGKAVLFMSNGPGPEVIQNDESGMLCDCTDSNAIANKIIALFDGRLDACYLGKNAMLRVEELFDLNKIFVPANLAYYKKITGIEN